MLILYETIKTSLYHQTHTIIKFSFLKITISNKNYNAEAYFESTCERSRGDNNFLKTNKDSDGDEDDSFIHATVI